LPSDTLYIGIEVIDEDTRKIIISLTSGF